MHVYLKLSWHLHIIYRYRPMHEVLSIRGHCWAELRGKTPDKNSVFCRFGGAGQKTYCSHSKNYENSTETL